MDPGSARVASLLAPPWNDDGMDALGNLGGLRFALVTTIRPAWPTTELRFSC